MDNRIVFNAIIYGVSAIVMLGLVFILPGRYKIQYFISVLVFLYYAVANILYILGYFDSVDVSTAIRWVSALMPMQLIGSAVVVYLLLKHIRRIEKYEGDDHAER